MPDSKTFWCSTGTPVTSASLCLISSFVASFSMSMVTSGPQGRCCVIIFTFTGLPPRRRLTIEMVEWSRNPACFSVCESWRILEPKRRTWLSVGIPSISCKKCKRLVGFEYFPCDIGKQTFKAALLKFNYRLKTIKSPQYDILKP